LLSFGHDVVEQAEEEPPQREEVPHQHQRAGECGAHSVRGQRGGPCRGGYRDCAQELRAGGAPSSARH